MLRVLNNCIYLHYYSFLDLNSSLFSCALFLSSFVFSPLTLAVCLSFFPTFVEDDFSFSGSKEFVGLELGSRFFFDLDSDREVPRTILVNFWTVLSVIDSALDNFGDLIQVSDPDLTLVSSLDARSSFLERSSLNDPDFETLLDAVDDDDATDDDDDWDDFVSLARKLLELLSLGLPTPLPSCFDFSEALSLCLKVARIFVVILWEEGAGAGGELSSWSGPSSGIVGWLSDLLECFLKRNNRVKLINLRTKYFFSGTPCTKFNLLF